MLVLAIVGAGGIFTGTNPAYTMAEIVHHIRASNAKFVISEPEILQPFLVAMNEVGIPQNRLWIFDTQEKSQPVPVGMQSWHELLKHGEQDWVRFNDLAIASKTTACRFFSSGTTGLPKAVIHTHTNLVAQLEFVNEFNIKPYEVCQAILFVLYHFFFFFSFLSCFCFKTSSNRFL
jgi:acyl-CoA synthetase (AMP-forming)/AMP-acid ligase II